MGFFSMSNQRHVQWFFLGSSKRRRPNSPLLQATDSSNALASSASVADADADAGGGSVQADEEEIGASVIRVNEISNHLKATLKVFWTLVAWAIASRLEAIAFQVGGHPF